MPTRIAVIGMGYVGVPIAALLADVEGYDVTGVQRRSDRSGWKIEVLNSGKSCFEGLEPGLDELLARVVKKGTFRVTDDYQALKDAEIILIDVQTPTDGADHSPSYDSVKDVSRQIGKYLKQGVLLITESTIAPGTTQHVIRPIIETESGKVAGRDFLLAYSYERVMPGKLIEYIVDMPRVVGGINRESELKAVEMYKKIVRKPVFSTDILTAEAAKTMENAYRDVNIAFANEMALICESLGIDVWEVQKLINARSDRHMHLPGAGVGGHCLPKDTWLLRYGLRAYGREPLEAELISLARAINDHMPLHMAELARRSIESHGRKMEKSKVVILGVAYLEDSDDTRNTPASSLALELSRLGCQVVAHDPYVKELPGIKILPDLFEAARGADALAIVTKHKEYFQLDFVRLKQLMRTPVIIDGRRIVNADDAKRNGFVYSLLGRGR